MNHQFEDRDDALLDCKVCGGEEGALPTECPSRMMTPQEIDEVYAGELNFSNGKWWSPIHAASAPLKETP